MAVVSLMLRLRQEERDRLSGNSTEAVFEYLTEGRQTQVKPFRTSAVSKECSSQVKYSWQKSNFMQIKTFPVSAQSRHLVYHLF